MKILALDLGDVWVGMAVSDALGLTCRPLATVTADLLERELAIVLKTEQIGMVLVGDPLTHDGGASRQTVKIRNTFKALQEQFSTIEGKPIQWQLWDERFTSYVADSMIQFKGRPTDRQKRESHARAAAVLLRSYLEAKRPVTLVEPEEF